MAAHEALNGDQFELDLRNPAHIAAEAFRRNIDEFRPPNSKSEISNVQIKSVRPVEPGNPTPEHTHVATYSYDADHPTNGKYKGNVSVGLNAGEEKPPSSRIWGHLPNG